MTYSVWALLINADPILGSSFVGLDVNVKELVPVLNLNDGVGSLSGSSIKNVPYRSP